MAWVKRNRPVWFGYAVSIAALMIAAVLRWQLSGILDFRGNFVTFYPAVTIAALHGGLWLGLSATIASALLANLFLIAPASLLGIPRGNDLLDIILFIAGGILISYLVEMVNRGQAKAHNAEQQLAFAAEREKTQKERKRLIQVRLDLIEYAVTHTIDELLSKALDEIGEIVESPIGFYQFVEKDQKTLSLQQWSTQTSDTFCKTKFKGRHYSIDQAGIWADCIRQRRAVIHNDYDSLVNKKGLPAGHASVVRELVVPVMREGRVVAVVGVGNKQGDYTEKDAETVTYLSDVTWEIIERKRDEEKIRQNEITLRTVLDQLPSGVAVRDVSTGALILANVKGREIAGTLVDDAAHFPRYRFFYPDGRQYRVKDWPFIRSMTAGEVVEGEELEYERADGARLTISMSSAPIRDPQGQIIMSACVFNDITEHRRAEQRLRESEALLAESQKIGHLGSWSFDLRADRFTCSDEVYRILGVEPQEFDANYGAFIQAVHPEDRKAVDIAYSRSLPQEQGPFDTEFRIVRRHTGEVRYVQAKCAHQRDGAGTVLSSVGMVLDITERKMAEGTLREREELLHLFIKHAPASLAMLDREMKYLAFSQRWLSDHNLGDRDLVGLSNYEVFPEIPERWKEIHRRALAGEVLKADSDVFERADGSVQWVRWEVRPWRNAAGDVAGILIFSEDITELTRRAEELFSVNRALKALSNTAQAIIHAADESELLKSVCRIIVEDCGYHMGWIGFAEDDEDKTVTPAAQAGFEEGYLQTLKITWSDTELGQGPTGTAIRTGIPDVCCNILTEPRMRPWQEEAIKRGFVCSLALPLNTSRRTLGALTIYSKEPDAFSEPEVTLLARLTDELAYGISALKLRHAHRLSEKNLRESQARLDLALRSAGMGTWHWDIPANTVFFDEQACRLLGMDPATFSGTQDEVFRVVHADDRETIRRALVRTIKQDVQFAVEHRSILPDGRAVHIAARGKLSRDDQGRPERLNGLIWDITELKLAEEEVKAERKRLFNVLEALPAMICLLTPDYHVAFANRSFRERFGESQGRHCYDYCFGHSEPCDFCETYKVLETGLPHHWQVTTPGGSVIDTYDFPFTDVNGSPLILEMDIDITERKQIEEKLRQSRAELELRVKERTADLESAYEKLRQVPSRLIEAQERERQRLAGELHDSIGQTIAALKFRIEHVITAVEQQEYTHVHHLLREFVPVLQRSIDETRAIYMGLKPMILAEYGILATLEWYRQELLTLYPKHHIELETAIKEEDIPDDLKIVVFRIAQEALNNSFKHGKPEWVDVRLSLNGGVIELEISDDGVGMDLDFIMESRTAKTLGLIGMKERAELSGGEFSIRSVPHEGTTVKVDWRNL